MRRRNHTAALILLLAASFMQPSSTPAQNDSPEPTQVVVVAKTDLVKGATPTESSLEEKRIPVRLAPVTAVSGISQVIGRTLKRAKLKGSPILMEDLSNAGDPDNNRE